MSHSCIIFCCGGDGDSGLLPGSRVREPVKMGTKKPEICLMTKSPAPLPRNRCDRI